MHFAQIAELCGSWPGVSSDVKWRDVRVHSVGGKMFCLYREPQVGAQTMSFKVSPERFLELTDQPGIQVAPYLARHGWIQLDRPDVLPAAVLHELLHQSYCLVRAKLPKKQRDALSA